jgi:hypothetical protein
MTMKKHLAVLLLAAAALAAEEPHQPATTPARFDWFDYEGR